MFADRSRRIITEVLLQVRVRTRKPVASPETEVRRPRRSGSPRGDRACQRLGNCPRHLEQSAFLDELPQPPRSARPRPIDPYRIRDLHDHSGPPSRLTNLSPERAQSRSHIAEEASAGATETTGQDAPQRTSRKRVFTLVNWRRIRDSNS